MQNRSAGRSWGRKTEGQASFGVDLGSVWGDFGGDSGQVWEGQGMSGEGPGEFFKYFFFENRCHVCSSKRRTRWSGSAPNIKFDKCLAILIYSNIFRSTSSSPEGRHLLVAFHVARHANGSQRELVRRPFKHTRRRWLTAASSPTRAWRRPGRRPGSPQAVQNGAEAHDYIRPRATEALGFVCNLLCTLQTPMRG